MIPIRRSKSFVGRRVGRTTIRARRPTRLIAEEDRLVAHLIAGLAVALAAREPVATAPYVASDRVLPEVHAQVDQATESYESGDWNRTIARSNVVLFVEAIRYKVEFNGTRERDVERQRDALRQAIEMWEEALGHEVQFVEDPEAIVTVTFQDSVQNRGQDVGGHIKWRRDISVLPSGDYAPNVKADIWIRTKQPNGRSMTVEAMKHVAGHELGHVLGMSDSRTVGDIMGPLDLRRPTKQLGQSEIEALRSVRLRAADLRRASLVSAIRELEGYNSTRAAR